MDATPEELARLAVENLNRGRIDPQNAATMSRRRFFLVQMNSLIIAVITCIGICIFTLSRVENLPEFFFGPCGIINLMRQNFTDSDPNNDDDDNNNIYDTIQKCSQKKSA